MALHVRKQIRSTWLRDSRSFHQYLTPTAGLCRRVGKTRETLFQSRHHHYLLEDDAGAPGGRSRSKGNLDHCIGRKIMRSMIADDSIFIDRVSRSDFEASILGKTIVAAHHKRKNMWLELDSPPLPSFQFGIAGAVYIKGVIVTSYKRASVKDTDEWPSKYSKFFVELDVGVELSFTDKRRFARVRLLENPSTSPPISELGPDALLEPMTIDELVDSLKKKKIGIKALLLDQARIHPLQISSSLPKESCVALHNSIREVVQFAVEVDANCSRFSPSWLFHVRWGKKAGRIDGKKIEFIVAGGRTTAFVPALQKLYGSQTAKASVKPRKETAAKSKGNDGDDDEDGHTNFSLKSKGGKGGSRSTPQVATKGKVVANTEGLRKTRILKRKTRNVPARSELGESDRNGDEEPSKNGLRRSTRRPGNPPAKAKLGDSDRDGDEDHHKNGDDNDTKKKRRTAAKPRHR